MRNLVRDCVLVTMLAGAFWILRVPDVVPWQPVSAPTTSTLVFLFGLAGICLLWSREQTLGVSSWRRAAVAGLVISALLAALVITLDDWIIRLVWFDIDVNRADMLVQIREAVARFSGGLNPYVVYHVPWELPLSYGPLLWMWYLIPHALGADLRFVTIFGHAFVFVLLGCAAASEVHDGRWLRGVLLIAAALALLVNPMFDEFLLIGHTPAYWPMVGLFALLVASGRHVAAAAVLGALLGARTTMVALVPVFLMYLWRAERERLMPALASMVTVVVITFGPFLILDWRMVLHGMFFNYVQVVRDYVWAQTDWMASTLGLTRVLVASGWSAYVGLSQAMAMAVTYAVVWSRLGRSASPSPWFCVSLAVFSMTTVWPVWYVFLDVFVLGLALLAADWSPRLRARPWTTTAAVAVLTCATIAGTLLATLGVYYAIEPGRAPRWHLRSGFGPDASDQAGGYVWAIRDTVYLRVPRAARTDAQLEITCAPYETGARVPQTVVVRLNDEALGQIVLRPGIQTISLPTMARHWRIGHNELVLTFGHALPAETGENRAARINRITIRRE